MIRAPAAVGSQRLNPSGSAGTFTDVSKIPLSAIDHIDVISDGAVTLYGSDAMGGVVNFVLRGHVCPAVRWGWGAAWRTEFGV